MKNTLEGREAVQGDVWGTQDGAPKDDGEKNLLEDSKGIKVIGDMSARHIHGSISNRMLQQVYEASPACTRYGWIVKQEELTDGVQACRWGQYPPTLETQSKLIT